jgi:hypothetical protein
MSGSLTGFFRAEVYVIHEMHSTDDFFIRQPAWPKKSRLLCNLYTIFYQPFTTHSVSHQTLVKMIHGDIFPQN